MTSAPASWTSQSNPTPVASSTRRVASVSSGPVPSPGIRVTRWATPRDSKHPEPGRAETRDRRYGAMSPMDMSLANTRVLLVHANPFQRVLPVPPYGLERIRVAAEAVGAHVELVDPYVTEADPAAAAVAAAHALRPHVVGLGIRVVDDCIVVDTLADDDPRGHDVTWFLPEVRRLRD